MAETLDAIATRNIMSAFRKLVKATKSQDKKQVDVAAKEFGDIVAHQVRVLVDHGGWA